MTLQRKRPLTPQFPLGSNPTGQYCIFCQHWDEKNLNNLIPFVSWSSVRVGPPLETAKIDGLYSSARAVDRLTHLQCVRCIHVALSTILTAVGVGSSTWYGPTHLGECQCFLLRLLFRTQSPGPPLNSASQCSCGGERSLRAFSFDNIFAMYSESVYSISLSCWLRVVFLCDIYSLIKRNVWFTKWGPLSL